MDSTVLPSELSATAPMGHLWPTAREIPPAGREMEAGAGMTVILHLSFLPLWVLTATTAEPGPTEVTRPLASTVTTEGLLLAKVIL